MLRLFWQKFKTEFTYLASEWGPALLNQIMWWTFSTNCIWKKNHSFKLLAKIHSIFLIAKKPPLLLSKFTMKDFQCQLKWVRGYVVCALCSFRGYTNKRSGYHWAGELEVFIYQLQFSYLCFPHWVPSLTMENCLHSYKRKAKRKGHKIQEKDWRLLGRNSFPT